MNRKQTVNTIGLSANMECGSSPWRDYKYNKSTLNGEEEGVPKYSVCDLMILT